MKNRKNDKGFVKFVPTWYERYQGNWITYQYANWYVTLLYLYVYMGYNWDNCFTVSPDGKKKVPKFKDAEMFSELANDNGCHYKQFVLTQVKTLNVIRYGSKDYVQTLMSINRNLRTIYNKHCSIGTMHEVKQRSVFTNKRIKDFDKMFNRFIGE